MFFNELFGIIWNFVLFFCVQLDFSEMAEVKAWSCSCAAGAALCHHAVGLLYQLQDYQRRGLRAVPPIISKTSAPQVR
jgi:hypothetical protein